MIKGRERYAATEPFLHLLLRDRSVATNNFISIANQLRILRSRACLRRQPGVALANQSVEIRKNRSGDEEGVVFVEPVGFIGRALPQQPDHKVGCVSSPGIG